MDKSTYYEIRIRSHLENAWADWFEGLTITNEDSGESLLSGWIPDQAALQGILRRIGDLGLALISVNVVREEPDEEPTPTSIAPSDPDGNAGLDRDPAVLPPPA